MRRTLLAAAVSVAVATATAQAMTASSAAPVPPGPSGEVTLPTGDRVELLPGGGALVEPAEPARPGAYTVSRRDGDLYVVPAIAEPFLGRGLDPALFDVSRIDPAVPAAVRFTGPTPPGVTATGAGAGNLTDPAALGAALRHSIGAAVVSGWRPAPTLPGAATLAATTSTSTPVQPDYDMWTVKLRVLDGAGHPAQAADVDIMNTDDSRRYLGHPLIADGTARLSVPAGHYSALAYIDSFDANGDPTEVREVSVADLTVDKVTTLTLDARKAKPVRAVTPRPAIADDITLDWMRRPATGLGGVDSMSMAGPGIAVYAAPTRDAQVGELHYAAVLHLSAPGYTYSLAFPADRAVPARQTYRVGPANLATLHARYFTDVPGRVAVAGRVAQLANGTAGFQFAQTFPLPLTRTEYVSADPSVQWSDAVAPVDRASPMVDVPRTYRPGTTQRVDWFHGPLVPGFGADPGASTTFPCPACRDGDALDLTFAPTVDSTPGHTEVPYEYGGVRTIAVAHVVLAQGATVLADNDGWKQTITVPAVPATYALTMDETRQATWVRQSTASHTEWTFAGGTPPQTSTPPGWTCRTATAPCAVLPLIVANYELQVGTDGTVPPGPDRLDVGLGHLPGAAATPIEHAGVEVSFDDGATWTPTIFAALGGGHFRARWTNPASVSGGDVAIRVTARDAAGATFTQVVHHALTITGSAA